MEGALSGVPGDWYFWHDFVHEQLIASAFRGVTVVLSGPVDKGVINPFFDGMAQLVRTFATRVLRPLQTGYVRNYALGVMLGVIIVLGMIFVNEGM